MSQIFGKVTNAILSGTNETSFSLANLNLGFSLVKLEAPIEFQPLGSALSVQRRRTAELGSHHQTARLLGALFSHVAPNAPKLLRAFGQRVSEIIKTPGANPAGTPQDGPFKDSVGADATSIWAAATSGSASLVVLLLACLLARKFDDPKLSVALWVEIVAIRQKEVLATAESTGFVMSEAVIAAHQRILREDLATFDASVRAWLITADQVMIKKLKQLRLILDNLTTLPVSAGKDTYAKIINAWEGAINGFEALLDGNPQNATDSSVLLALSAWHLYPDLIVLSSETKKTSVAITVGLSLKDDDGISPGFQWSLALSHFRYYGEPVSLQTDHDNYRITVNELCLIAFGSLLFHWNLPCDMMVDVVSWFCSLDSLIKRHRGEDLAEEKVDKYLHLHWLQPLMKASKLLVDKSEAESADFEKLVRYGRRRGKHLLGDSSVRGNSSFLGLCDPHVAYSLAMPSSSEEEYLRHVRSVAESNNILTFSVIQYFEKIADIEVLVLATATPTNLSLQQDSVADGQQPQDVHVRWVVTSNSNVVEGFQQELNLRQASFVEIVGVIDPDEYLPLSGGDLVARRVLPSSFYLRSLPHFISGAGFQGVKPLKRKGFQKSQRLYNEVLDKRQRHAHLEQDLKRPDPGLSGNSQKTEVSLWYMFCPVWSASVGQQEIGLFTIYESDSLYERHLETFSSVRSANEAALKSEEAPRPAQLEQFSEGRLVRYLTSLPSSLPDWLERTRYSLQQMPRGPLAVTTHSSLFCLALLLRIYARFPCATFPIKIAESRFCVLEDNRTSVTSYWISRRNALACVCMMEMGGIQINASLFDRALAVAAGNSIFVAESLLSDPSQTQSDCAIRRIAGNLGRPGVSVLVSPETVMVKEKTRDFRAVEHAPYDYRREDNFAATSLHLSLTEWRVPVVLSSSKVGNIDQDIFQVEAVVSVHDRGRWYGDIDVLAALEEIENSRVSGECLCGSRRANSKTECISIGNFEELLDPPDSVGIFRAHENWSARLAAACIAEQTVGGSRVYVLNNNNNNVMCWNCLESEIERRRRERGQPVIKLTCSGEEEIQVEYPNSQGGGFDADGETGDTIIIID
ncbi:hypothetical protein Z517_04373 [Fonsecaea pedrosoi CBS 271.37]|uniref:Uncharacterized protein n=1 Tax=Fonsecaea pedrosoi CBS 271.37 TaxID=1442368 RepID=A0A0D2GKH3_9EURO|nr:uncharacterized protein Z517_04373 [Fonsecaea pedrosoi CBS 271.37]KIW81348.1 hypothetical protein Z517_04373 [Fonsecaea pedrosoi CBS 271.37]